MNNLRVLVVDDSTTMIRIISNTLKRLGITNIEKAEDGMEGLRIFNNKEIDLVLSDINMPKMNGMEMLKEIRKINQDVPVVMITTEAGKVEVIAALKAGANNYITKPFTPQVLKEKLSVILGIG